MASNIRQALAAGLTTGAIGIMIANPTDLVKVRMQAEGKLAAGCVTTPHVV
jgi:solute carrier family 25 uncoupling protein 8/9